MVVDIGGGTSEIAVISLGGIVCSTSVKIAGNVFNNNIVDYMGKQHNMKIGVPMAERLKVAAGSATSELKEEPENFRTKGRDI